MIKKEDKKLALVDTHPWYAQWRDEATRRIVSCQGFFCGVRSRHGTTALPAYRLPARYSWLMRGQVQVLAWLRGYLKDAGVGQYRRDFALLNAAAASGRGRGVWRGFADQSLDQSKWSVVGCMCACVHVCMCAAKFNQLEALAWLRGYIRDPLRIGTGASSPAYRYTPNPQSQGHVK